MDYAMHDRSTIIPVPDITEIKFDRDEVGWVALAPTVAVTVLATIVVLLRWYTRSLVAMCLGIDDYIIILSMLLAWAMCIVTGLEYGVGFGSYGHRDVDVQQLAKLIVTNNDIWSLATNVTKASLIAQYLRVFTSPTLRYACAMILFACLLSACWAIFAGTFLCHPIEKLWTPGLAGRCLDPLKYWMAAAGLNSSLDLTVLILPLPWIVNLRLPRRQKVCIITLFMLGFLVFIVSIVRFVTVYIEAQRGDRTKSGMYAVLWSAIEVNIGIICASALALKPLITHWWPSLLCEGTVANDVSHSTLNGMRLSAAPTVEAIEIPQLSRSVPSSSASQSISCKHAGSSSKGSGKH